MITNNTALGGEGPRGGGGGPRGSCSAVVKGRGCVATEICLLSLAQQLKWGGASTHCVDDAT